MHSKIYVGQVSHKRYMPREHAFKYRMFMMYLDLDELPNLFDRFLLWSARRFNLAYFDRKQHMGSTDTSLKQSVIDFVQQDKGIKLDGPIRLLAHMRYFGYGFNPVSFYYCFDKTGDNLKVIVAEVNNTPWGEQFSYVLPVDNNDGNKKHIFKLDKRFHVSPFNPMKQNYEWRLSDPQHNLSIYMKNNNEDGKIFEASLSLKQKEITSRNLSIMLFAYPFMTMKIIAAIYYEALKLLFKKTPVYDHPGKHASMQVESTNK